MQYVYLACKTNKKAKVVAAAATTKGTINLTYKNIQ
jgi:hypothetical protein